METNPTILIVDDTEANIDILVEVLKEYDVVVALDGATALEIVQQESIDLILLDVMMPVMDGYQVCYELKQIDKIKEIPIIFLTAKIQLV
jgi:CheY-like chemotaxis protein